MPTGASSQLRRMSSIRQCMCRLSSRKPFSVSEFTISIFETSSDAKLLGQSNVRYGKGWSSPEITGGNPMTVTLRTDGRAMKLFFYNWRGLCTFVFPAPTAPHGCGTLNSAYCTPILGSSGGGSSRCAGTTVNNRWFLQFKLEMVTTLSGMIDKFFSLAQRSRCT